MKALKDWISLENCVIGDLYKLDSRNLKWGLFTDNHSFRGMRTKFGEKFLDEEYHYDTGPPYGTAKPIQHIPKEWLVNFNVAFTDAELLKYLKKLDEKSFELVEAYFI